PRVRLLEPAPVEPVVDEPPALVDAPALMPGSLSVEPAVPVEPTPPVEPDAPALMPGWPDIPVLCPMPDAEPAEPEPIAPEVPPEEPDGMAPPGVDPPVAWADAAPAPSNIAAAVVRMILRMEGLPVWPGRRV
ncbi:MAG: hypothetical protein JO303_04300, partial [Caulobacteraceae bacterium]|nr:hypothetical protein [Caulobacteraceae bacterium]